MMMTPRFPVRELCRCPPDHPRRRNGELQPALTHCAARSIIRRRGKSIRPQVLLNLFIRLLQTISTTAITRAHRSNLQTVRHLVHLGMTYGWRKTDCWQTERCLTAEEWTQSTEAVRKPVLAPWKLRTNTQRLDAENVRKTTLCSDVANNSYALNVRES